MKQYHVPVLLNESISMLNVCEDGLYFDGTLGGGGHSYAIMKAGGRIIATDRDIQAIDYSRMRFSLDAELHGRYALVKNNFKNVLDVLSERQIEELDGAILDLGISSHQVDEISRGFSYNNNAILDMRMDRDQLLSALTVVNEYSEQQLAQIIYTYGEERYSRKIARAICEARVKNPIESTKKLADIVKACVPAFSSTGHPAKKTFQAIRIEVNNELSGLGEAVCDVVSKLKRGARICIITFHSLEDRIIKHTLRTLATDCICDKKIPVCVCGHKASVKLVSAKGIKPSPEEVRDNPRSKSATLRVAEKL